MWYRNILLLLPNVKPKCETKYEIYHGINIPILVPKSGFPYLMEMHPYVEPKCYENVYICDIWVQFIFVVNV